MYYNIGVEEVRPISKYRPKNDARYRANHRQHRRYLSYRSTARTFVRRYAKPEDVDMLWDIWAARKDLSIVDNGKVTLYERRLIRKLKVVVEEFCHYMKDFADYDFDTDEMKSCMDCMGRMEAYNDALLMYDPVRKDFCEALIGKGNRIIHKAHNSKRR